MGACPRTTTPVPASATARVYRGAAAFVAELLESSVVQRVVHPSAKAVLQRTLTALAQKDDPLATALALAKAGEVLKDAAEGRPKVFDVALDTIRVALALYAEGLGRSHHRTLATRLQIAETLAAKGDPESARRDFVVVLDELQGDEAEMVKTRKRAMRGLEALDARHTVSATLRRERRRRLKAETAALEAGVSRSLYGQFAGRRNPDIDEGGAIEGQSVLEGPVADDRRGRGGRPIWRSRGNHKTCTLDPHAPGAAVTRTMSSCTARVGRGRARVRSSRAVMMRCNSPRVPRPARAPRRVGSSSVSR